MPKMNQSAPQRAARFIDEQVPPELALAHPRAAWNGLTICKYAIPALPPASLQIPALLEDVISIQIDGATDLQGRVGQQFQQRSRPGDIFIISRGEPTTWEWTDSYAVLNLYLDRTLLTAVAAETTDIDPARVELMSRIATHDPLIYQIGLALLSELRSSMPASQLYIDALTQTLIVHLLRKHAAFPADARDSARGLAVPILRRALEYIGDNLANDLTLTTIAAEVGVSPYHLARCFKRSIGQSLHQYATEQRLERAKQLLMSGEHSIAGVAALTGFADQSHLQRHFKQRYGVTPGAVLEQSKNIQSKRRNIQDKPKESD
jgi:AraC family transcriptional regulator